MFLKNFNVLDAVATLVDSVTVAVDIAFFLFYFYGLWKYLSKDFCIACTLCFLLSDLLVNPRSSRGKEFLNLIKTTLHFFVSEYLSSELFGGN